MHRVVIGIGSNIKPMEHIAKAREMIRKQHHFISESRFIQTRPIGFTDQPDFYNGVFLVDTEMSKKRFKKWLKVVEKKLGRVRTENRYGPRTIDLDIAVWDDTIVDPDFYQRDFLQKAVMEVYPELDITKQKSF
jgi:2-amino-4-hydroxy-6-hydroxymethyldihydropteridine diphosphokinase